MSASVLIAGGGTGGHLFPGLAVAAELKRLRPELRLAVVGAGRALEGELVARAGLNAERLKVRALRGQGLWGRLRALAVLPGAVWGALRLIRRYRPGLVLAVGGYAAFPLGLAAFLARVPLAVQEQNAILGMTNRALSRLARVVFVSFPGAGAGLPERKVLFTGNPVRPELLAQAEKHRVERPEATRRFNLLVLGGSQGARSINRALCAALPLLADLKDRLSLTHQTGRADLEEVRRAYNDSGLEHEVSDFFDDMGRRYALAHLVICRSGAGTVTELAAVGRAALCVPYPYSAGGHQEKNAAALAEAGGAQVIQDAELSGELVARRVREFMEQPARLAEMETAARSLGRPQAAERIAEHCLAIMEGNA